MTPAEAIGKWDTTIPKEPEPKQTLDYWIEQYALSDRLPVEKHRKLLARTIEISEETFKRIIE